MQKIGIVREGDRIFSATLENGRIKEISSFEIDCFFPQREAIFATSLSPDEVLIRSIEIPLSKRDLLYKSLPFQVESLLPYPLDEGIIAIDDSAPIIAYCCQKKNLEQHLAKWKHHQIDPDYVISSAKALSRYAEYKAQKKGIFLHIHQASDQVICLLCSEGKSLKISTDALLERSFHYLFSQKGMKEKLQGIVLSGQKPYPQISSFFDENLPIIEGEREALAIGLALEMAQKKPQQFRLGPFSAPSHKRKIKKLIFTSFALLWGLAAASFIYGKNWSLMQKKHLENSLDPYMSLMPGEVGSLEQMDQWLKDQNQRGFIQQNPIFVGDVYSWLSQFREIQVEKIDFSLEKFPTAAAPTTPYLAKVSLRFNAPSIDEAEGFKQFLQAKDSLMRSDQPLTWNRTKEGYEVSFFVKNR